MKRVQIQLNGQSLEDVVLEMAKACERAVLELEGFRTTPTDARVQAMHKAIHATLEKYVHAYDTCGLASLCQEGAEIDPWSPKGQDED